jgi:Mrp family chromosome partitioning ATPase
MSGNYELAPVETAPNLSPIADPGLDAASKGQNPLLLIHSLLRGRYKWAIPLALVLGIIGGLVGYRVRPARYRSVGLIRIKAIVPKVLYSSEQNSVMPMFDAFVQSQVMLIQSQRLVDMAMQKSEWQAQGRGMSPEASARFVNALEVVHPKSSEIIQVSFVDENPDVATAAVRSVIDAYQKVYGENDVDSGAQRIQVLEERRATLTAQLKSLTDRILAIATEFGSNKLEPIYEFKLKAMNELESELKQVQLAIALAEARKGASQATVPASMPTELSAEAIAAIDSQTRECLRLKREAEIRLRRLQQRVGENHPSLKDARMSFDAADRALEEAVQDYRKAMAEHGVKSPVAGVGNLAGMSLTELRAKEQSVKALYEREKAETIELGRKNLQIEDLKAQADVVRTRLEETKARIEQLNVESVVSGRISVVSNGDRPLTPNDDKRIPFAAAGGMGGAALGMGVFVLIGLLDRRFRSIADAEMNFQQVSRILGILPSLPDDLADPEQVAVAAHCVHHIRALLQIHGGRSGQNVYAVTSPTAGDGKTSLTLSLGLSFAASGSRTLVIDCDVVGGGLTAKTEAIVRRRIGQILRREGLISDPQLREALRIAQESHRRLGEVLVSLGYSQEGDVARALSAQHESTVGLFDVLAGEPLAECVTEAGARNLYVLPLGTTDPQNASQLSPAAVRHIIDQARKSFDVVLIDTGPILGSLEASIVAAEADQVVVVVSRGAQRLLAEKAIQRLIEIGSRVAGIVFNRANIDDTASSVYSSSMSTRSVSAGTMVRVVSPETRGSRGMGPVASSVRSTRAASVDTKESNS